MDLFYKDYQSLYLRIRIDKPRGMGGWKLCRETRVCAFSTYPIFINFLLELVSHGYAALQCGDDLSDFNPNSYTSAVPC